MEIRFISSMTPEDEALCASALFTAVRDVLVHFPIAFNLRIETTGGRIFQHDHTARKMPASLQAPVVFDRRSGRDRRAEAGQRVET
ncbi:MAG: hypothetical protein HYU53_09910 [Acidobacteria bacterium]|nr:hypothetical protein [Acidobacteriota bacterium]